jgi:ABC-type transport system substrate-binding protein
MRSVKVLRLALATALATVFAGQAASETVLRWASAGGVLTWDPHVIDETPSLVGFRQVYESQATIDADLILRPALATSWQLLDPITWRFELREGVTFHDGTPFSAEDVVFSLERDGHTRLAYKPDHAVDLACYQTGLVKDRKATRDFGAAQAGCLCEVIVGDACDAGLIIGMVSNDRKQHERSDIV